MLNNDETLGIPNYGPWYYEIKYNQNLIEEINKIHDFINNVINLDIFDGKKKSIQFINYGKTQLVFVLTVDDIKYTLLVNQPATVYGTGKKEFDNLSSLSEKHENVIKPLYYFNNDESELYVTPYVYQSRCIGVEIKEWGMWIPEPFYHFRKFSTNEKKVINKCMVALLIKFYDEDLCAGLSKCRLDGGDFMIEKGFEEYSFSDDNILKRMKLIACRDLVYMNLDDYIEKLKNELMGICPDDERLIMGKNIKCPLTQEEIEDGIKLGIELRNNKKIKKLNRTLD